MITNKGDAPILVNHYGEIPSKFTMDVTGVVNFRQRNRKSEQIHLEGKDSPSKSNSKALAMKVETPKSLQDVNKNQVQYYIPAKNKLFGYTQIPRQQVMPY